MEPSALSDPSRWVDLHGDLLYSFALLRSRNEHVAQDLVQETFKKKEGKAVDIVWRKEP